MQTKGCKKGRDETETNLEEHDVDIHQRQEGPSGARLHLQNAVPYVTYCHKAAGTEEAGEKED